MMRFAQKFSDFEIVTTLSSQLSYSHFIELLPQKTDEARMFYANESARRNFGIKVWVKKVLAFCKRLF
jgi:1,2-phenylacetyl-CoA epoxidase PaaB subunit